jgi:hypothetical protein
MAWAVVDTKTKEQDGSKASIVNTALTSGAANGNLLVGVVTYDSQSSQTITLTDNGSGTSNTYTQVSSRDTVTPATMVMFWCVNQRTSGTLTTVTATFSANATDAQVMILREYSGNAASPDDGSQAHEQPMIWSAGTDVVHSGTVAPSVAGDLLVGAAYTHYAGTMTAGTGFSNFTNLNTYTGYSTSMESAEEAGTTAREALFSNDGGGTAGACIVAAFKEAGGAVSGLMWLK